MFYDAVLAKDEKDQIWAKNAREKDEKFGLYLNCLSRSKAAILLAEERLKKQETRGEAAKALIEGAGDILGPYLGETVSEPLSGRPNVLAEAEPRRSACTHYH